MSLALRYADVGAKQNRLGCDLPDPGAALWHLSLTLVLALALLFMTPVAATFKIVCNISAVDTQSGADNFPLLLDLLSNGGLVLLSAPVASLDAGTIASPLGDGASSGVYSRSSMLHIVSSAANKSAARLSRSSRYRCKSSASTLLLRLDRLSGYMLLGSEYGVDISTYIPYK